MLNNKYKLYNSFMLYNICSQIFKIFGIGTHNNLNKKVGVSKNTYFSILKIIQLYRKYNVKYYILKQKLVLFPLKQEINNNIRIKIIKKIYQGLKPHLNLYLIFKYMLIFKNQISLKKKLLKNLKIKKLKLKKNDKKIKMQFKNIINKKNVYFC